MKKRLTYFKGTDAGTFIDQKTIDVHIGEQAEQAYEFVLRHINKSAIVEGVYTNTRWQYPVVAVREAIRNALFIGTTRLREEISKWLSSMI